MRTTVSVLLLTLTFTACGPRLIKLPDNQQVPAAASFKMGANARTSVLGYEVPGVKVTGRRAVGFSVGGMAVGKQKEQQHRAFMVTGGSVGLEVGCDAVQEGAVVMARDFTRHTYLCGGANFELRVEETARDVFTGVVRLNDVSLEIESTDEMAKGPPQGPSGFHLRRNGRWLGSMEYFPAGNVYLSPALAPAEREAVLTAMVTIQSTNLWLARGAHDHSSL